MPAAAALSCLWARLLHAVQHLKLHGSRRRRLVSRLSRRFGFYNYLTALTSRRRRHHRGRGLGNRARRDLHRQGRLVRCDLRREQDVQLLVERVAAAHHFRVALGVIVLDDQVVADGNDQGLRDVKEVVRHADLCLLHGLDAVDTLGDPLVLGVEEKVTGALAVAYVQVDDLGAS